MTWTTIATIKVTRSWQLTPSIPLNLGYVRLSFSTAGVPVEIAQVEPDSEDLSDERQVMATPFAQVLEFPAPPVFTDRAIALRTSIFTAPFDIKVEISSMPISRNGSTQVNVQLPTAASVTASSVNASTTSAQLLAANSNRKMASFTNNSTGTLYIELGTTASATAYTVALGQNDTYELPIAYTGAVSGIWSATNGNVLVREFV